jgi:hypothetical protein
VTDDEAPPPRIRRGILQLGFACGVVFAALVGTAAWLHIYRATLWGLFPAGLALLIAFLGNGGAVDD